MMKTTLRVAYTALTILYFTLPGLSSPPSNGELDG